MEILPKGDANAAVTATLSGVAEAYNASGIMSSLFASMTDKRVWIPNSSESVYTSGAAGKISISLSQSTIAY